MRPPRLIRRRGKGGLRRGIFLIRSFMDEVALRRAPEGGMEVRMVKRRPDAAAIGALYTEDAASIQPAGDWNRGRAAIAAQMQSQFDSTTFTAREDITEEVIPAGPDYVFEVGQYRATGTAKVGGKEVSNAGRYVVLWRKDADGVWRIHRDLGADAPKP